MNGTTRFLWGGDSDWQCLEERDGSDNLVARFTYSPGYIDAVAVQERDLNADSDFGDTNEVVYYEANTLFSVYALSDSSGSVIERYRFDAYGGCTVLDADGSADADGLSDVKNPYTFTGRRFDTETGLMQYRYRYYSPALGRFVSRDPAASAHSGTFYAYVVARPTVGVDPTGQTVIIPYVPGEEETARRAYWALRDELDPPTECAGRTGRFVGLRPMSARLLSKAKCVLGYLVKYNFLTLSGRVTLGHYFGASDRVCTGRPLYSIHEKGQDLRTLIVIDESIARENQMSELVVWLMHEWQHALARRRPWYSLDPGLQPLLGKSDFLSGSTRVEVEVGKAVESAQKLLYSIVVWEYYNPEGSFPVAGQRPMLEYGASWMVARPRYFWDYILCTCQVDVVNSCLPVGKVNLGTGGWRAVHGELPYDWGALAKLISRGINTALKPLGLSVPELSFAGLPDGGGGE